MRPLFVAAALLATTSVALGQTLPCKPAAPRPDPGTGFAVVGGSEQILARGGNSGSGWEWAVDSVKGDLDWTPGVPFQWSVTYSGSGTATLEVRRQGALVLSLSKSSGMQTGNAIHLQVSTNASIDADTTVAVSAATINGHAVSGTIAQSGNNQNSAKNLYFYFPEMEQGLRASGTATLTYATLPAGSRVDFRLRTGNVPCNNEAPTVSVSAPAEGSLHQAGSVITLSANAQDIDGTLAQVEFLANGIAVGTAASAPFTFNWTNPAAGNHSVTARATDNTGDSTTSTEVNLRVNAQPTASITSPAQSAVFTAPASIPITAQSGDTDGTIARVEFYHGSTLITTLSTAPYNFVWTDVPQGSYSLTAKVIDNDEGSVTSDAISISVNSGVAKLHYIHVDHLNTPRLIANESQQAVWRWDQQEPFGANLPDGNRAGLGAFDQPLRLPGQYFDTETGLHYNYFRDYDPSVGRYVQSDPIGLDGGLNTYAYAYGHPLGFFDPDGLEVRLICRPVGGGPGAVGFQHCFVHVTCPQERWASTLSLYAGKGYGRKSIWPRVGYKAANEGPDNPDALGQFDQPVTPNQCFRDPCAYEKGVIRRFNSFQSGLVAYSAAGPNSNSFAAGLITGNQYGGVLPAGAPGPVAAPGINTPHPGFSR